MYLSVCLVALLCMSHWSSACQVQERGVSDELRRRIVNKHNELRAKVANGKEGGLPTASNMLEMTWDDSLAQGAQGWADKCVYAHDDPRARGGRGHTGQNIAYESKGDKTPDWDRIIMLWYDEVNLFNPHTLSAYQFEAATGHFTQVIWAKTNKIGCGYVAHSENGQLKHLYGCNYGPGGNMIGEPIYKAGKPCSDCGGCGSTEGLCGGRKKRDADDDEEEEEDDMIEETEAWADIHDEGDEGKQSKRVERIKRYTAQDDGERETEGHASEDNDEQRENDKGEERKKCDTDNDDNEDKDDEEEGEGETEGQASKDDDEEEEDDEGEEKRKKRDAEDDDEDGEGEVEEQVAENDDGGDDDRGDVDEDYDDYMEFDEPESDDDADDDGDGQ